MPTRRCRSRRWVQYHCRGRAAPSIPSPWIALALIVSAAAEVVVCARGRHELHGAHATIEDIQGEVLRTSVDERSRSSVDGGV